MGLFFSRSQTTRADRLVQGIGQDPQLPTYFGHLQPLIQKSLGLLATFRSHFAGRALLGRRKKSRRSSLPVELHVAFDCYQRHPECTRYLRLSRIAIDDQLSTKKPESRQSTLLMDKHRQMTVKVVYLSIPLLNGNLGVDVRYPCWKDRQLYLWHAKTVATFGQKNTHLSLFYQTKNVSLH